MSPSGVHGVHDVAVTPEGLRQVCGRFATGVMIVTGRLDDGAPIGVTVNSFTSVSLEPPFVLFCLANEAFSAEAFAPGRPFAFTLLSERQRALSERFAQQGLDKFSGADLTPGRHGALLIQGGLAWIECRVRSVYPEGDHSIIVGAVQALGLGPNNRPLLYYQGRYAALT